MKWGTAFLSIRMELGMEVFSRKKKIIDSILCLRKEIY